MDPGIAAGFSNLTAALLGSADDDAAMARARASDASAANSYAAAEANRELARGRGVSADRMKELAGIAGENNPAIMSKMAEVMGLNAKIDPFGNLVEPQNPLGPKMSIPAYPGADGVGTDMGIGNLANAFFGDLSANPQQFTAGLNNLSEGADSTLARSMILNGDDDAAARAALMLYPAGGKNQNPGFAQRELQSGSDDARFIAKFKARRDKEAKIVAAELQHGEGGSEEFKALSQEKWKNYSADQIKSAQIEIATMDDATKIQIAKDKLAAEIKRLESKDINDQYKEVNGYLVMSEALAKQLGVTTKVDVDGQDVFAFRKPSPTEKGVTIYLGEGENAETITVTSASLAQIAPKNINGRLIIPEGFVWGSGSKTTLPTDQLANTAQVAAYNTEITPTLTTFEDNDVPSPVLSQITALFMSKIGSQANGENFAVKLANVKKVINETYNGKLIVNLDTSRNPFGGGFSVPGFIMNQLTTSKTNNRLPKKADLSNQYGFSLAQSAAILAFINQPPVKVPEDGD
tara:strand:+ start:102 stop:1664 length:1563 start_codon:yes stop_codon:yes gene_type:complete